MAIKADVANQDTETGEAAPVAPGRPARSGELPLPDGQPEAEEATEDDFQEVPTVANRALPVPGGTAKETPSATAQGQGAGTYRLVRPTVSDFVDQPVATKIEPSASKGVAIGEARKPR
jgi:hypothetical protein